MARTHKPIFQKYWTMASMVCLPLTFEDTKIYLGDKGHERLNQNLILHTPIQFFISDTPSNTLNN